MYRLIILGTLIGVVFGDHHDDSHLPSACRMPPDTSDCGGSEQRWFYHPNLKACSKFLFKGCQNSPNHFATKEDCESHCLLSPEEEKRAAKEEQENKPKETKQEANTANQKTHQEKTEESNDNIKPTDKVTDKPKETTKSDSENPSEQKNVKSNQANDSNDEKSPVTMEKEEVSVNQGSETDDVDELVEEQDELRKRFNMADDEDFLALERYMQDDNVDLSDILPADETVPVEGDILANFYEGENEEIVQEKDNKKIDDTKPENNKEKSENSRVKQKKETSNQKLNENKESQITDSEKKNEGTDEDLDEMIEEEKYLEEKFGMADSDDMLELQRILQGPDVEVQEVVEQNNNENSKKEINEKGSTNFENYEKENNKEDSVNYENYEKEETNDEELDEVSKRRDQFSMADNADYMALEELMGNPNVQEMEIVQEDDSFKNDKGDKIRIAHMEISNNPSKENPPHGKETTNISKDDTYGEHLDHTNNESDQNGQTEEDATIQFEEELEKQFHMADRDDILSLEQIIQDPNIEMGEVIPADKAGEKQDGDINGVFSMAASFLGDDNKEQSGNFKEINVDIQQLPEIAKNPINEATAEIQEDLQERSEQQPKERDFTHPADKLVQQVNIDTSNTEQPMDFEKMGHDDKMMLISLLHLDGMKVNKLAGTSTPMLKSFKSSTQTSPNKDLFEILKINGIRKCCILPRDSGPCKEKKILQWHFDPMIGTCLPFFYGGCKGNRNRFDTIGECLRKCGSGGIIRESSLPEPIPEPPTSKPSLLGLKSMISGFMPGKILSLHEKMSPGQQKFVHKFIKSALKHVSDINIKPIKLGPFFPTEFLENRVEKRKEMKPPVPLKSVMFKWPILKMVFDKRNRDLPIPGRPEPREGRRMLMDKFVGPAHRDFRRRMREREDFPFGDIRQRVSNGDNRRGRDRDDGPFKEFRKRGRENEEEFYRKQSKHFSPSFKKTYKMMSHHEDNRHQISSDPKNKVNLIQVFVNKPNTESNSNPTHHHTMIKKNFSPEPQIKAPLPPAAPVNRNTPPQALPPQQFMYPHSKSIQKPPVFTPVKPPQGPHLPPLPHHNHQIIAPLQHPIVPQPHSRHMHVPHSHPPFAGPHTHFHVHHPHPHPPPLMHNFPHHPPPPFFDHPKPWWARFDRPYYEPPFHGRHPHIRPSTGYPHKRLEEFDNRRPPPEKEDIVVVTMPSDDNNGELHYACLLPVSTGMCKAFVEKYYFNQATGECEMFIYGGCGGNANNYGSVEECQATCMSTSPVPKAEEATTRPDDTIIITSPVYVPNSEIEKVSNEDSKSMVVEPVKDTTAEKTNIIEKLETESDVKIEPVSLFKSTNTEYIIVIAVMCFVGLAVVILVALAVVSMSRRSTVSKKERVLEAVLSSHLEGRSTGTLTPRSHYYGQPPSDTGPPPISDVPKIHKETFDEQL